MRGSAARGNDTEVDLFGVSLEAYADAYAYANAHAYAHAYAYAYAYA